MYPNPTIGVPISACHCHLSCTLIDCASHPHHHPPLYNRVPGAVHVVGGGPEYKLPKTNKKYPMYWPAIHSIARHAVHSITTCDPFNSTREVSGDPF